MDSARSPSAHMSAASSWLGIPTSDLATPFGPTPPTCANTEAAGWLGVAVGARTKPKPRPRPRPRPKQKSHLRIVRAAQRERRRGERRVFFPPSRAGGPGGVFRGHDVRGAHEPSHAHALGCVDGQRRAARRRPRRRRRQIARERVAEILLGDDDAAGALGERRQTRRARRFAAAAKDIHGDAEGSHLCTRERRWLMVSFSCVVSVRFSVNGKRVGVNVRA